MGGHVKKPIAMGALLCALSLAVPGTAAAEHENTLTNLDFTTKTNRAGTAKRPRPVPLGIAVTQTTSDGSGQPATSTALRIALPREFRWRGSLWPRRKRCNPVTVNRTRNDGACPRGSRVGGGHVTAVAGGGGLVEEIDVSAYVTTGGDLGLFLDAIAPVPIQTMLVGEVSRARTIRVAIPRNIQEPAPGVLTGISTLRFSLNGSVRLKGRRRGAVESVGCRRRWTLAFESVFRHGSIVDSDTVRCRR
jgi:hypothetical protein